MAHIYQNYMGCASGRSISITKCSIVAISSPGLTVRQAIIELALVMSMRVMIPTKLRSNVGILINMGSISIHASLEVII